MSLLDELRHEEPTGGVHLLIELDEDGWQEPPIAYYVHRERWDELTDEERQTVAHELMAEYWPGPRKFKMSVHA